MRKNTLYILSLLVSFCFINGLANDVVIHSSTGNGHEQIYLDPPYVTYDDDLNELLGEGFIVENGATFNIKTPGKVIIDGCVFQSGANVKIEAGSVEIVKSFTAEQGSKVEFKQLIDD